MKMPVARANAVTESLPTLVCACSVFLRIRRIQAAGGSNSTAEGWAAGVPLVPVVEDGVLIEPVAEEAAGVAALLSLGWFSFDAAPGDASVETAAVTSAVSAAELIVSITSGRNSTAW